MIASGISLARQPDRPISLPDVVRQLLVDPGLVVVAFQVRRGRQANQILVAHLVLGEQDQVIVNIPATARRFFLQPTAGSHVNLAPDDRLDSFFPCGAIEVDGAIHSLRGP